LAIVKYRKGVEIYKQPMRWLYHLRSVGEPASVRYAPPSLAREGFVHASYRDAVAESARLHFPVGAALEVLRIDPGRLDVEVVVAVTPRGEMPHIHGSIVADAIVEVLPLDAFLSLRAGLPDALP
jgi:uncharacterized protein (DUF952 family)